MRTLVVSDFHLGARLRRAVLLQDPALEALLDALATVDRLVLLGDVVELLEGRPVEAMEVAEPVLRAIGGRLDRGAEVILVPGNHDGDLVAPWLQANGMSPALDAPIPPTPRRCSPRWSPRSGRPRCVRYPGVWLAEGVWATHGHYLDRHLLPEVAFESPAGCWAPAARRRPAGRLRARRRSVAHARGGLLTRWLPRPLASLVDDLAELLRAATMPRAQRRLLSRRISPLTASVLGTQMRRASIPALARVVHRLGVAADSVVFGHVHRSGPLPGDQAASWTGPGGSPRIVNPGSWVYEPLLVHHATPPHPYWPGGAVLLEDGRDPVAIGLLDHLDASALH